LSAAQRDDLARRLVADFMSEEEAAGSPPEVLEAGRRMWQVVVHEPSVWTVAGRPLDGDEPHYLVRVGVLEAWREALSAQIVHRVTRIVAATHDEPERFTTEPLVWVEVVGIPEGGVGCFGRPLSSTDVVRLMTAPFREAPDREERLAAAGPGNGVDPVCGMTVPLAHATITFETGGETVVFCSEGCRDVYEEDLIAAP
jgi:YHS domain-containing protein